MTIQLMGRIDSSNAAEIETKINEQIGNYSGEITLDASALEYISSAGLRIILRLKKANAETRIINCSSDVYEIFDMTGFTELMEIAKAYRHISVEGCEIIGEGANGTVYRTDPDTIVKVYSSPDSLADIHRERELARKAFVMGIPTAIPYDVVKVGDLYGSVFELLNAKSFAQLINEGVSVESLAKQSVEILKTMHATVMQDGELPRKKDEALSWAQRSAKYLPAAIGEKLISLFEAIPETNTMLHGDFHVKNIMQQNGENLLIDMDTLSMGHPIFELAAIFSAYKGYSCGDDSYLGTFFGITADASLGMLDATFRYYFDGCSETEIDAILKRAAIISYTRIYRWMIEKNGKEASIAFCRDYLLENIPKTDKLYF